MTLRRPSFAVLAICLLIVLVAAAGASAAFAFIPLKRGTVDVGRSWIVEVEPAVRAESSFTYSATLARLVEKHCGKMDTSSLDVASAAEKAADPIMAALAVTAAERRAETITSKSCKYIIEEIDAAEWRIEGAAAKQAAGEH